MSADKPTPKAPPQVEALLNEFEAHLLGLVAVIRKFRKTLRSQDTLPPGTDTKG